MSFEYEHAVATAHQPRNNAIVQMVKFSLWKYHNALDLRKNGDVAAHHLKNDIEAILGTPWVQGKTLGLSHGEDATTVKTSNQRDVVSANEVNSMRERLKGIEEVEPPVPYKSH